MNTTSAASVALVDFCSKVSHDVLAARQEEVGERALRQQGAGSSLLAFLWSLMLTAGSLVVTFELCNCM